jgi:hypothetical protein
VAIASSSLAGLQFLVRADHFLEGGKEQIDDLRLVGVDREMLAKKQHVRFDLQLDLRRLRPRFQQVADAPHEIHRIVRLGDEVVRAALQPLNDVHRRLHLRE